MAKYANITADVRRYSKNGSTIEPNVQFTKSCAPDIIIHKNIITHGVYVFGMQEEEATINVLYLVVFNWSTVDVDATMWLTSDGSTAENTFTIPASDINSPGLLIVPHIDLSGVPPGSNNEIMFTPQSGRAKLELFVFAQKIPG